MEKDEGLYRRVMELERRLDDLTTPNIVAASGGEFNLNQLWNLTQIYSSDDAGKKPTWYTCRSRLPIYTIVQDGDDLNLIEVTGWDGVKFKTAARIGATVDGAPALDSVPGKIVLSTTKAGDTGPTDRLRIDSDGYVHIFVSIVDSIALGCRAYRSITQSLPDGTLTPLSWNTEVYDTNGGFSPTSTRLYAKHAGYYIAGGGWGSAAVAAADHRAGAWIRQDGSKYLQSNEITTITGKYFSVAVATGIFYMAVDQYIEIVALHDRGSAISTAAAFANSQNNNNGWLVRVA